MTLEVKVRSDNEELLAQLNQQLQVSFYGYSLIMSSEALQIVYHAACMLQLTTEILIDFFTFFRPLVPCTRLFTLSAGALRLKGGSCVLNGS